MDTIFINSETSKTSGPYITSLSDKINLKKNGKYVALSNHSMYLILIRNQYNKLILLEI